MKQEEKEEEEEDKEEEEDREMDIFAINTPENRENYSLCFNNVWVT